MKSKFIVIGGLIGAIVGITSSFLFPNILLFGLKYNESFNKGAGYLGSFYSITGGSVYNALPIVVLIFSLFGAICGLLVFKLVHKRL